jgi:ribonuclease D
MPASGPSDMRWIASQAGLELACGAWRAADRLALDTEFVRERTFRPILGLIQVADGGGVTLIDPLAVGSLAPLAALLASPALTCVLHSCGEDLEVFRERLDMVPPRIFDTQLAAAFAGYGHSLGYSRLIGVLFGLEVPKTETRSDWLRRPLSPSQLVYAALDVEHLLPAAAKLAAEVEQRGWTAAFEEESAAMVEQALAPVDLDAPYRKIAQSRPFSRRELGILHALSRWREDEARRRDLARNFVVHESALPLLTERKPETLIQLTETLGKLEAFRGRDLSRLGPQLLEIIAKARILPQDELPESLPRALDVQPYKKTLQLLRAELEAVAAETGLPVELLANRRTLESLIRRYLERQEPLLPRRLRGWREAVVGRRLAEKAAADLGATRAPGLHFFAAGS